MKRWFKNNMNNEQKIILQEELEKENVKDSLMYIRTNINNFLEVELALTSLMMVEEFHPLLSSINEKYPNFSLHIQQRDAGEWRYLNSHVEVLTEGEVSDFVCEINEYLDKFVSEQFSDFQIKNFFPNNDLNIEFNGDYSKESLKDKLITSLVSVEANNFIRMLNLQKKLHKKEKREGFKSKV